MTKLSSVHNELTQAAAVASFAMQHLLREEDGQDLIEYALIFSFVALGAVASMKSISSNIAIVFNSVGTILTNAT